MRFILPMLMAGLAVSADNNNSTIEDAEKDKGLGGLLFGIGSNISKGFGLNKFVQNLNCTKGDQEGNDGKGDGLAEISSGIGKAIGKEIQTVKQPIAETVAYVGTSQCSNVKKLLGVSYEQLEGEKEPDLDQLTLEYRDKEIRVVMKIATAAKHIVNSKGYNPHKKLIIYIHGFTDDPSQASFNNITDALMSRGEYNVLALDGSSLIKWLYLRSTTYVRFMGEKLGETLATLVHSGVDPNSIHIIGHSLGAHISGFTAKTYTYLTGGKIGRISGLDPAGPCFSNVDPELRLKATDAQFVDVIHTDGGVYGMKEPVGQVDYFPNSGSEQPSCLLQSCSHSRAWLYFTESVINPDAFPARKCKNWNEFKTGKCEDEISYMGWPTEPGTRGLYYLQTGEETPFGLGEAGLSWKNKDGIIKSSLSFLKRGQK